MADIKEAGTIEEASNLTPIVINAQYIKDLSFEAPAAPGIFQVMKQKAPDISVNVNVDSNVFEKNVYEIILTIEAHAVINNETVFLLELEYGGVFTLNCETESIAPLAYIECPRLLFPFARAILSNTTREGGFPPLMLGTVDFVEMFQRDAEARKNSITSESGPNELEDVEKPTL
jgi:preprotein translocase subunit SecB